METRKPELAAGIVALSLSLFVLVLTLHPNVWGFWAAFFQPGLWVWPVGAYSLTIGALIWGAVQVVRTVKP